MATSGKKVEKMTHVISDPSSNGKANRRYVKELRPHFTGNDEDELEKKDFLEKN